MPTVRVALLRRERRQEPALPARAADEARLHRPRRERQGRQHQPLHQGLRRDLGGRPDLPPALGRGPGRHPGRDDRGGRPTPARGGAAGRRARAGAAADGLYAPTWEGWTVNPYSSSIATMGPALVALAAPAADPHAADLQAAPAHRHRLGGGRGGPPRDRRPGRGPRRPARRCLDHAGGHHRRPRGRGPADRGGRGLRGLGRGLLGPLPLAPAGRGPAARRSTTASTTPTC